MTLETMVRRIEAAPGHSTPEDAMDDWTPIRTEGARATGILLGLALLLSAALPQGVRSQEEDVIQAARASQTAPRAEIVATSLTVSATASSLEFDLASGDSHTLALEEGRVLLDGEEIGRYEPGSEFESSWRDLLREAMGGDADLRIDAGRLLGWDPPSAGTSPATVARLERELAAVLDALAPGAGDGAPAVPEEGDAVTMTGPDGDRLAIAPGRLDLEELVERFSRLERSLSRLGDEAAGAAESLALVVHDDYEIAAGRTVAGNVALLGGDLGIAGTVRGDVLVLDGTLSLESGSRIEGDVLQVGGEVEHRGGLVTGETLSVRALGRDAPAAVPDDDERSRARAAASSRDRRRPGFFGSIFRNFGKAVGGLAGVLSGLLLLGLAGALTVYFARPQLEVVADTARYSFARSFGVGVAGQFLFVPVLLVLAVAVVTWLVIPFYLLATVLALLGGYLAVAHATGEVISLQRFRSDWMNRLRRSNSYYYLVSGLVVLLLPFALEAVLHVFGGWLGFLRGFTAFVGVTMTWVAATAGLGAVLLSRGGRTKQYARSYSGAGFGTGEEDEG